MPIPILEACRKRKRGPKLYGFHTFSDPGYPINPSGPFRDNIRVFLRECAEIEDHNVDGMPTWCTLLVHENRNLVVPLYTIEENVNRSLQPFCDHCRSSGWSGHLVSKQRYHIIIPADDEWNHPLENGVLDAQNHLLHGLIHCNGFGHLLCINGIEGGSRYLCGKEVMDLWDRICNNLRARKITVEDVSRKRSMDLRLLNGVAYGHSWFGRWGYRFCHGSFGVSENNYEGAIGILSSIELDKVIQDFGYAKQSSEIKQIIRYYRDLSETQLITIRDLFRIMLTLKSRAPPQKKSIMATDASPRPPTKAALPNKHFGKEKSVKYKKFTTIANMDSRWPARRLEYAAQVIVDALKEKKENSFGNGGMTRQEVRDAARLHIGDTGLLDYVLKSMNNVMVGSHVVRRAVNPSTRILEYTIHEHGNRGLIIEMDPEKLPEPLPVPTLVAGADVYRDIFYLYTNVLLGYPESELVQVATQAVLDSKHFVKEWPFKDEDDQFLRFICRVMPSCRDQETEFARELVKCGEIIVVQPYATVGELKEAAQSAMRDTYCIMEQFVVTDIEGMEEKEDEEVLFGAVESASVVWVRGVGIDLGSELKYEGGADNWTVRCECGAQDDDGERMVACDICGVWQHTICCGIEDADAVPPLFVCQGCSASLVQPVTQPGFEYECPDNMLLHPLTEFGW